MPRWWIAKQPIPWINLWDKRILITADRIRKRYGPILINTYCFGGNHQYRGWREFDCPVGADYSQHKFGRALDMEPVKVTVEEIREDIRKGGRSDPVFQLIGRVENRTSWLHIDTCIVARPTLSPLIMERRDIYFFNP